MRYCIYILILLAFQTCFSQWEPCGSGLWGGNITALAEGGNIICAGTRNGQLFLSSDKGENWSMMIESESQNSINGISISGKYIVASVNSGIIISTDFGKNWIIKTNGLDSRSLSSIAIRGDSIYVCADGGMLFSVDSGNTWKNTTCKIPVTSIKMIGNNFYVAFNNLFYVSTNNGKDWESRNKGLGNVYYITSICAIENDLIISTNMGIFLSSDSAKTWESRNKGIMDLDIRFAAVSGKNIIVATKYEGMYISTDIGLSWSKQNVLSKYNPKMNFLVANEEHLITGTSDAGVFISTDQGINWDVKSNGIANAKVFNIAANGNNVYANVVGRGVYNSTDNGNSWNLILPVHRPVSNCIALNGNKIWVSSDSAMVYLSTDNGVNWTIKGKGLSKKYWIYCMLADGENLWLGNDSVRLSTDNGDNWLNMGGVLTPTSISVHGQFIMAGREGKNTVLSSDSGKTWVENSPKYGNDDFAQCHIRGNYFIASYYYARNYYSTDYGETWNEWILSNLYQECRINAFASLGKNIFGGFDGCGVYVSSDRGIRWEPKNNGLESYRIKSLAIGGQYIYAGTDNRGIFRCKLSDLVGVLDDNSINHNPSELIGYYNILGERVTDISQFHGLLIKVQRNGTKIVAEKVVME